jgi:hypothetical protein
MNIEKKLEEKFGPEELDKKANEYMKIIRDIDIENEKIISTKDEANCEKIFNDYKQEQEQQIIIHDVDIENKKIIGTKDEVKCEKVQNDYKREQQIIILKKDYDKLKSIERDYEKIISTKDEVKCEKLFNDTYKPEQQIIILKKDYEKLKVDYCSYTISYSALKVEYDKLKNYEQIYNNLKVEYDKLRVEQEPFQPDKNKEYYGYYYCKECKKQWESGHCWIDYTQQCKVCKNNTIPYSYRPKKIMENNGMKKEHMAHLCEKCKKYGVPCNQVCGQSHNQTHNQVRKPVRNQVRKPF